MELDSATVSDWLTRIAADSVEFFDDEKGPTLAVGPFAAALARTALDRLGELVDDDHTRALLIHAAALGLIKGCADALLEASPPQSVESPRVN